MTEYRARTVGLLGRSLEITSGETVVATVRLGWFAGPHAVEIGGFGGAFERTGLLSWRLTGLALGTVEIERSASIRRSTVSWSGGSLVAVRPGLTARRYDLVDGAGQVVAGLQTTNLLLFRATIEAPDDLPIPIVTVLAFLAWRLRRGAAAAAGAV